MGEIDRELLDIIACPVSHASIIQVGDWLYSTDRETRRKYPIRDGIPIMLVGESELIELDEFDRMMRDR